MKVSNSKVPPIKSKTDPILPFYYTDANNAKLKLKVKDLGEEEDACFQFQYMIGPDSGLAVSYGDLNGLDFRPTLDSDNQSQWFPEGQQREGLCVTDLTKSHDKTLEVSFTSKFSDPDDHDIVVLRLIKQNDKEVIEVHPIEQGVLKELPFLTHWSQSENQSFEFDNQWPLRYPDSFWTHENGTDTIRFLCKAN